MKNITAAVFETYSAYPRTAILMSGKGTNAEAILNDATLREHYQFEQIVTDNTQSRAGEIAQNHGLQYKVLEGKGITDAVSRGAYFGQIGQYLDRMAIDAVIYAGFMRIASSDFCKAFPGVNVHPADLTVKNSDGQPAYTGMDALPLMRSAHSVLRATVHVVDTPVDCGTALALSEGLANDATKSDWEIHELLKQKEHAVYVATLRKLGEGTMDITRLPYVYDGKELESAS